MIVLDASAAVLALLNDSDSRAVLATEAVASPHLVDLEVAQALRAHVLRGTVTPTQGATALATWAQLGIQRFASTGLLERVWELRDNVSAYDASYLALAEALGCALVTADARLARASGPRCPITVVRR